jgi:hypothetical protein
MSIKDENVIKTNDFMAKFFIVSNINLNTQYNADLASIFK